MVIFNSVLKIRKKVVWVKALFQRAVKIRDKLNQQIKKISSVLSWNGLQ